MSTSGLYKGTTWASFDFKEGDSLSLDDVVGETGSVAISREWREEGGDTNQHCIEDIVSNRPSFPSVGGGGKWSCMLKLDLGLTWMGEKVSNGTPEPVLLLKFFSQGKNRYTISAGRGTLG